MDCRRKSGHSVRGSQRTKGGAEICREREILKIRTTNGGISSQMRSKALNSRSSTEARHEENREIAEDNRLEVIQIEMLKKWKRSWGDK